VSLLPEQGQCLPAVRIVRTYNYKSTVMQEIASNEFKTGFQWL
jgi:hypothetical protein